MNIIEIIHLLIFFYLSVGGYIISEKYIPVYLLTIIYIIIDWNDKDGLCWITKLNNMIKYKSFNPIIQEENENNFIKTQLEKIGVYMEAKKITFILYILFIVSWLVAYSRLIKKYKIKVFPNKITQSIVYFFVLSWIIVTYL